MNMPQTNRYTRQTLLPEIGEEGQLRLKHSRVLLVGVGGLGSPIATYLTGAGIGTLGIVDDDVVSLSNLHRQVLYDEASIGMPKTDCARTRLHALNSEVTIHTYNTRLTADNAHDIISQYDLVIDGTDNFAARFAISDACTAMNKPYIYGAICGLDGQVSVLCKGRCTYRTLHRDEAATLSMPHPGKQVSGVTPAIVGSVQANQALQLICGFGAPLIDRLWSIDLRTMQSFIIDL